MFSVHESIDATRFQQLVNTHDNFAIRVLVAQEHVILVWI
jgi:hypothetical protein